MSLESVRAFFRDNAPDIDVLVSDQSAATVELAARTFGVPEANIAKTLALRVGERNLLVVMRGTARLDNKKARAAFGGKIRMLDAETTLALTSHPVGGVCPFGLATPLPIYCDVSLRDLDQVVPAAGSIHAAVRIPPQRMAELVHAEWVDVCQSGSESELRTI